MKPEMFDIRHVYMLKHLSQLPRKILRLYNHPNITEFVLHDLCHNKCFNLTKAAYFVDNPDFDCFRGVAGYSQQEPYLQEDIWHNPDDFSSYLSASSFNQQVRSYEKASEKGNNIATQTTADNVAKVFSFQDPLFFTWDMKHDNTGLLVCQPANKNESYQEQDILNGLSLLSFCPIF